MSSKDIQSIFLSTKMDPERRRSQEKRPSFFLIIAFLNSSHLLICKTCPLLTPKVSLPSSNQKSLLKLPHSTMIEFITSGDRTVSLSQILPLALTFQSKWLISLPLLYFSKVTPSLLATQVGLKPCQMQLFLLSSRI